MSLLLLLAALLPGVYWTAGPETAPTVQQARIKRLYVPPAQAAEWHNAGVEVSPLDEAALHEREKAETPAVQYRPDVASATSMPWVDANGWRFERHRDGRFYYDLPAGAAPLAAAEAFAYGADAILKIDPRDLEPLGRMLAFLEQVDGPALPPLANIGVVDDGSDTLGEVMNLLARRNLLFRVVAKPDPTLALFVRLGTPQYPVDEAQDPFAFAAKLRQQLTDDRRLLRIYGSQTTLGYLTGDSRRARLHLINYGRRGVAGMRVRLRGEYAKPTLRVFGVENAAPADWLTAAGATEFSVPEMRSYAVVDLEAVGASAQLPLPPQPRSP